MQQIGGRSPPLSVAICGNQAYKYSKGELLEVQGDRCTLPWEVGSPRPLSSPFSFDDVHQIEALSKLPGRVVPLFRATEKPRSRYYKILTSHKLQQIGGRSPPTLSVICEIKALYKYSKGELLEVQGTGAPYPGRVGSPVP